MRILLVEDDAMLADAVARALRQSAHAVDIASDGERADAMLRDAAHDLVLLDLGLPLMDGLEVLRRLRRRRSTVPVILLTVRDAPEDRVAGLDIGADDYITKPFNLSELEARVRALLRRANHGAGPELVHGRLRLDIAGRRLYRDGDPLELTAREFAIVELLLLREGRVVTKQQISEHLLGWDGAISTNALDAFVYRLRKKLESASVNIRTIRGMGYLIDKPNVA
jgi:two-component system OmpR family response regulator